MFAIRLIFIAAAVAAVATQIPRFFQPDQADNGKRAEVASLEVIKPAPASAGVAIRSNDTGHFESRFVLNGKAIKAMIDTGATYVAMNEATAKSLGLGADRLHFDIEVGTANGRAKAAKVVLSSVEIGSIRVRNVDALVLRGTGLDSVLIGMSFMQKLRSYRVEDDRMQLVN